jgi:formylglycine-generating enzyme required for sulfatase activity
VLIGTYPAQAQPILGTAWTNNQTILFWSSTYATNYVLQFEDRLPSTNWVLFTDVAPVAYGSLNAVTVLHPRHAAFFRLIQIPTAPSDGMVFIPASTFTIGDALDGESDAIPTNVYVSAFYISTNLVSLAQWQTVYNYAISQGYDFALDDGLGNAANQPVQSVNWYDVVKWSNARSQQAGLRPVYYTDAQMTQVYSNGDVDAVYADFTANGYRLPTEAEWEKAARGGLSGQRFPWGNTISESQANYQGDTNDFSYDLGPDGFNSNYDAGQFPYTSPVGAFPANGYGLNDMAGNVFEWCWDWYAGVPYPTNSPYLGGSNPTGPASSPEGGRVLRGGSWGGYAGFARCAYRGFGPEITPDAIGFRCVKSP